MQLLCSGHLSQQVSRRGRATNIEKAAKAQDTTSETLDSSVEASVGSVASPEAKSQSIPAAAITKDPTPVETSTNLTPVETSEVTAAVKKLSIKEDDSKAVAVPAGGQKELTAEEKAAVKADREAKKAEKAKRREEAKLKKGDTVAAAPAAEEKPAAVDGKVEEATSKDSAGGGAVKEGESEKKATTKAERRAKQEEQRKKKAEAAGKGGDVKSKESKVRVPDEVKADDKKTEKKLAKTLISQKVPARTPAQRQIPLFSHLHQYERETSVTKDLPVAGGNLHPAVVQLGLQYAQVLKRTFFE